MGLGGQAGVPIPALCLPWVSPLPDPGLPELVRACILPVCRYTWCIDAIQYPSLLSYNRTSSSLAGNLPVPPWTTVTYFIYDTGWLSLRVRKSHAPSSFSFSPPAPGSLVAPTCLLKGDLEFLVFLLLPPKCWVTGVHHGVCLINLLKTKPRIAYLPGKQRPALHFFLKTVPGN